MKYILISTAVLLLVNQISAKPAPSSTKAMNNLNSGKETESSHQKSQQDKFPVKNHLYVPVAANLPVESTSDKDSEFPVQLQLSGDSLWQTDMDPIKGGEIIDEGNMELKSGSQVQTDTASLGDANEASAPDSFGIVLVHDFAVKNAANVPEEPANEESTTGFVSQYKLGPSFWSNTENFDSENGSTKMTDENSGDMVMMPKVSN